MTEAGKNLWEHHAATLRRRWWGWIGLAVLGTTLFLRTMASHDPVVPALILLIPLIALRKAWRTDRQLARCGEKLAAKSPTIDAFNSTEESMLSTEKATFAAGCFWGVEEMFRKVPGVVSTRVGYTSGKTANPSYEQVCTGRTGHAEAIEILFDPAKVAYQHLVELFYENHDPTTLDRQGPDVGTQYRSGIYFHSPEQEQLATAETEKRQASGDYARPIVTEIVPATEFYPAEGYHQKYFELRGVNWSCHSGNGKRVQRKTTTTAAH